MEGSVNTSGVEVPSGVGEGNVGYGVVGRRVIGGSNTVARTPGVAKNDTVGRRGKVGLAVGIAF
jgi:hypothetical protein